VGLDIQNEGKQNFVKFKNILTDHRYKFRVNNQDNFQLFDATNSRIDLHIDTSTGKIGIGNTAPQELLDVNGNIHLSGVNSKITSDGDLCLGSCP